MTAKNGKDTRNVQIIEIRGGPPTLDEAQKLVGGYVQLIELRDGSQLLIDEEGRLKGRPPNEEATARWGDQVIGGFLGDVVHLVDGARWT